MKKQKVITRPVDAVVMQIINEIVDYQGLVNFSSRGIIGDPEMILRAFQYGFKIGVECTKKDVIRIIFEA